MGLGRREGEREMSSRLEILGKAIERCAEIERIFSEQHVQGYEADYCAETLAGFNTETRSGIFLGWDLVASGPLSMDWPYIEVSFCAEMGNDAGRFFLIHYFSADGTWIVRTENEEWIRRNDGAHRLITTCGLAPGMTREVSEGMALEIISKMAAFYAKLPAA